MSCVQYVIQGQVQGVGFRPFVYRLAVEKGLSGYVRNTSQGVEIVLQGLDAAIKNFDEIFAKNLPPLARVSSLEKRSLFEQPTLKTFEIKSSTEGSNHQVLISPDTATCLDCLHEIDDPADHRFAYAFTNCTNCGPRYSITRSIPYDRKQTSMACFAMCPSCRKEYEDPLDRRFHAQPNACPDCGPTLWYLASDNEQFTSSAHCIEWAARDLFQGFIVAIKGLGGFHLACRADDQPSIDRLRQGKKRRDKPLALMLPDLEAAASLAEISKPEKVWLCSRQRPIVLLRKKTPFVLPDSLAPDTSRIGLMLPSTPLHHLLLKTYARLAGPSNPPVLVMSSGNRSGEPLALGNREALTQLRGIADRFLVHNRDILIRCDDSVLGVTPNSRKTVHFRRARGFTPTPIVLKHKGPSVLALGAEVKSTVCLTLENRAYVSQHIGDLSNVATYDSFTQTIRHLQTILKISPQTLITDLHPDFLSTRYAEQCSEQPVLKLQHHFAHLYAVLGENQESGPILGLTLDGSGLGPDQTIWGGELLLLNPLQDEQTRLGHFSPVPLPGAEAAVREPWRMTLAFLHALKDPVSASRAWPWKPDTAKIAALQSMIDKGLNCPLTTSCGRLFDALSALLGLTRRISYEGQAAIRLETIQNHEETLAYPCPFHTQNGTSVLDTLTLFQAALQDWEDNVPAGSISRRFHNGLIKGLSQWLQAAARLTGVWKVGLSGGVFQNLTLAEELPLHLEQAGFKVFVHQALPPNDSCIAFGQAVFAQGKLR